MTTVTVTTQTELDAALADTTLTMYDQIVVDSPAGVWITIGEASPAELSVTGSSTVKRVTGSATVEWVDGSATVEWVDGSATVEWVTGSATVERVDGSATVKRVDGSATVKRAAGTSTVHLYDHATLQRATSHVAVFLHSGTVTSSGGHVIDVTEVDLTDPAQWLAFSGADDTAADGTVVVYKAVDGSFVAGQGHRLTPYPIGQTVEATDWDPTPQQGRGLHFGVTPYHSRQYFQGSGKPRFLAVEVTVADVVPLGDKFKAPRCRVLHEVDVHGAPITVAVQAAS